jgi:hypothetical protein
MYRRKRQFVERFGGRSPEDDDHGIGFFDLVATIAFVNDLPFVLLQGDNGFRCERFWLIHKMDWIPKV